VKVHRLERRQLLAQPAPIVDHARAREEALERYRVEI